MWLAFNPETKGKVAASVPNEVFFLEAKSFNWNEQLSCFTSQVGCGAQEEEEEEENKNKKTNFVFQRNGKTKWKKKEERDLEGEEEKRVFRERERDTKLERKRRPSGRKLKGEEKNNKQLITRMERALLKIN